MPRTNRRKFLKISTAVLGTLDLQRCTSLHALGANDRVVLGIAGINGRGMQLAQEFVKMEEVEIRYLADPDSRLFADRGGWIESATG